MPLEEFCVTTVQGLYQENVLERAEAAIKGSPLTAEPINRAAAKPMAMNTYKLDLTRGLVTRVFEQVV